MDEIAKTHDPGPGHPVLQAWAEPSRGLLPRIAAELSRRNAHPARSVVLVPYAQLMPLARRLWATLWPDGFAPRFETTMNWAHGLGGVAPGADDISFDMARDLPTAQALLARAGLGARRDALAGRLIEAAYQLASLAAAERPEARAAWAARAGGAVALGLDAPVLALESALARIAVAWAAGSAYASDALFQESVAQGLDCLVVLEGFQSEPLAEALKAWPALQGRVVALALDLPAPQGDVALHPASDAEDEAQRAAACVLRHLEAGRAPVALAATDRALTRRIRAMLGARRVAVRDENGWKLSTTRAAARVMGVLRACSRDAAGDAVLDWLKNAPAFESAAVLALEKWLRRAGVREWRALPDPLLSLPPEIGPAAAAVLARAQALREALQGTRPLTRWLAGLREVLQAGGQWPLLAADAAGQKLLAALRLDEAGEAELARTLAQAMDAPRRLTLAEFTAWANEVLEAASFVPDHPAREQVVILPFSQLLGRPFAALVLPGCDELRLPAAPEPPGVWTAAQRLALGLPPREALAAALRAAWRNALQTPCCDVLWRQGDDAGEPLLPSPLVQLLQLEGTARAGAEPRPARSVNAAPTPRPLPTGEALPVPKLSASAYEDLRRCPYRFFALRQLGLQEADELDGEVDKRDFGIWLHAVLDAFHQAQQAEPVAGEAPRRGRLDAIAGEVTRALRLADDEFLPFAAAWPQVRDGYLDWLAQHEAGGARFAEAERWHETVLGPLTLVGKIDRIDRQPDGTALVIDYKTEASGLTRARIAQPTEDTQLAFYAALLPDDTLRAAYVNVGEKDGTRTIEQPEVVAARDALVEGLLGDLRRIAEGAPLPALGEGMVCEFCAARGLCRKDFWS
jgi:ATP-dependent helicase/nuclease subunit B